MILSPTNQIADEFQSFFKKCRRINVPELCIYSSIKIPKLFLIDGFNQFLAVNVDLEIVTKRGLDMVEEGLTRSHAQRPLATQIEDNAQHFPKRVLTTDINQVFHERGFADTDISN